ncbi:MAG: surface lipoprotein assembly modifier [Candidatus Omnitrophica bacterium]|nr:surface lipoprotein assembly modifier [Candidatus Omnitrophota bacterium]
MYKISGIVLLTLFLLTFFYNASLAQESLLQIGIEQYRNENYEEALEILTDAYKTSPSTIASFYLALTYKQIGQTEKAKEFFIKAITEEPKITDAYIELAHLLYQVGQINEAKKFIGEAEAQQIMPAKISFLKGLIFLKEGNNRQARACFEKAKNLDKDLAQSADFQISLTYLSEKKFKKAKKSLEALIETTPRTDITDFAKDYLGAIERAIKSHKKWSFNFSTGYIYDDNVVSKPEGIIGIEAIDKISGKSDSAIVNDLKIIYKPLFDGRFYFTTSYEFYHKMYFHTHEYDMITHSIDLIPGYNFKNGAITFPSSYYHISLNGDQYMSLMYFMPTINLQFKPSHIFQLSTGYGRRDLLKYISGFDPDEDRDSNQFLVIFGYIYPFKEGKGVFYTRYQYIYDDSEGRNWESDAQKISSGVIYPLLNRLTVNIAADYTWQDYKNIHTLSGMGVPGFPVNRTKRKDVIYNLSAGLVYEISSFLNLNAGYTYTRNDSNFQIYEYKRGLYSVMFSFNF